MQASQQDEARNQGPKQIARRALNLQRGRMQPKHAHSSQARASGDLPLPVKNWNFSASGTREPPHFLGRVDANLKADKAAAEKSWLASKALSAPGLKLLVNVSPCF
ncbi:hypothetical protein J1605_013565 [Eschrichtius robustus]|uniref:Uncharacterized protein n=1 Tax=Eschrichtius robustus TaxID=9764 RepID=A0AB34GGF5_ESCRO|nr:hypothetical protein J1605_013565 [Eschrichtius robustus]